MASRKLPSDNKFLVAFSFAGEQRDLVRSIAESVELRLGPSTVFLDEWYEHYLAGHDADLKLQSIYSEGCLLVVVCVSHTYGQKPWTRVEHEAIRARQMSGRALPHNSNKFEILPIRVGDGEIEGIFFNTVVPDVRMKTIDRAAELIIDRLQLIRPKLNNGADVPPVVPSWPNASLSLHWPMANHSGVRESFTHLLLHNTSTRCLLVRGPSESGKSYITQQMLSNILHMENLPQIACGRFDFKGTTDTDAAVRIFIQHLGVPLPPANLPLHERLLHIFVSLKRNIPTVLIFDTYEAASVTAQNWVEKELLPSIIRSGWLRIIVVGQLVPEPHGTIWEQNSLPILDLKSPQPADWFEYSRQYRNDLTLSDVEAGCLLARNKASILAHLFGPLRG